MKVNVGKNDKLLRFVLSIVIAILGIYYQSWWGLLAIIPFMTASLGLCPMYKILNFSSCNIKKKT